MPRALVALQPVQLVSIVADPGEIKKAPFAGLDIAAPPPHPTSATSANGSSARSARSVRPRTPPPQGTKPETHSPFELSMACDNTRPAFLSGWIVHSFRRSSVFKVNAFQVHGIGQLR